MNRISLIILLSFTSIVWGQGDINLTVRGNREVEPAQRMEGNPSILDTVFPSPVINNPRLSLFYPTTVEFQKVEAAGIRIVDKLPQLYHSYAKLGIGTEFMPLGEFYFNQTRSRKYKYGLHLKHLSSFGYLPDYAPSSFDRNSVKVFGGIIENKFDLDGNIRFSNDGFHYYGVKNDTLSRDSINQRFRDAGFGINFAHHPKDSGQVNVNLGLDYNYFSTLPPAEDSLKEWNTRENYFKLGSRTSYLWGKELFELKANVSYNQYEFGVPDSTLVLDTGRIRRNTLIELSPTATTFGSNRKLRAKFGFLFAIDAAAKTRAYIYPALELKYSLFNDILIPYVQIDGGLTQQSFKKLSAENPFIRPSIDIRNEHRAIDFKGGIKGTISKQIGFNTQIRFAHIKNFALFVTDTLSYRSTQFEVIYDTMNIASIEGSLYYQLSEKLKIDAIGRYNSYTLLNNSYAWNLPTLELILRGKYNLFDKLVTQLDLTFLSGRKALVYGPEAETTLENGQYIKTLGLVTDINFSVEYLYNNRISAFVQLNNAAAQRYQRYYNYPVQAFQILGGFTFKF